MCRIKNDIEFCAPLQGHRSSTLNMGSNRNIIAKRFIPVREDNVVNLDESPDITLNHWHINITKMFSQKRQVLLSVKFLMEIVVSYKLSLPNKALFNTTVEGCSSSIIRHLNFIHECFHDMEYHQINLPEATNYYSMLEEVLTIYCSLELKTVSKIYFKSDSNNNEAFDKIVITDELMYLKRLSKQAQKMAFILHNFLHRNENVLHVLMKMWYNRQSSSCVITVRYLYTLLIYDKPIPDKSDESYCRYVINYLLWLLIERKEAANNSAECMIGVLNKKFGYVNNEIPNSQFIKKVLRLSGNLLLEVINTIQIQSSTIERYFIELKKSRQSRIFQSDNSTVSRPFESILFDVNDNEEINSKIQDQEPGAEESDLDSIDMIEIITLDSDDEDDDVQVISSSNCAPSNNIDNLFCDKLPLSHSNASLQSGTVSSTAPPSKPQKSAHLDSNILQSILQTIAEIVRKAQSGNSEHSVCLNSGSVTDTCNDISERFAAKRTQRSHRRSSLTNNYATENPNMSTSRSSIGIQASISSPVTLESEQHLPGMRCTTGATNLVLYMSDSQEHSIEVQLPTSTDNEHRNVKSATEDVHYNGQEQHMSQESRVRDIKTSSNKPPSQSTQSPEHIYPIPPPSIILKVITLNKVTPVELNESEYTSETGVKGLLGSDIVLLGHQATLILQPAKVMHVATEMTHTAHVRDKGFVQVVSQPDVDVEKRERTIGIVSLSDGQLEVNMEDSYDRSVDSIFSKDDLSAACANQLLPDTNQMPEVGRKRPHYVKDFNFPISSQCRHISEVFEDDNHVFINASPSTTPTNMEELTPEEEESLNRLLRESMVHMSSAEYEDNDVETRLPFKKRRMSDSNKTDIDTSYQQPKGKQRKPSSNKQTNSCSKCEELSSIPQLEISYPAERMISIAELQEQNSRRSIKTAAERKEMPDNVPTNVAFTNNSSSVPPYTCHDDCLDAALNISRPESYNRRSFSNQLAYPYTGPVLPPPVLPEKHFQATLASAYYSDTATNYPAFRFFHGSYRWQYRHWSRDGSVG